MIKRDRHPINPLLFPLMKGDRKELEINPLLFPLMKGDR